ncbi:MAG: acetyl-CoA carboxylase, carboxyltransferase subunit beta [Bacteriovoracaceae bacterium]|jgi:acetyl-CoA carboxylase carboxyl transferase subunit beta|nr:acetyl-CoA carboxylase, carboxyltransferase subunit beta [Bacteriovoracaceae bacterium]
MSWFDSVENPKFKNPKKKASSAPTGVWQKCNNCGEVLQTAKLVENLNVCHKCDHHLRIDARSRIDTFLDKNSFQEFGHELESLNPLEFEDKMSYNERLNKAYKKTGRKDGTICGFGKIDSAPVVVAIMDFNFMGGSMGVVTGEKIALAMDEALEHKIPCIVVSASGGARMQEGILSLMQMAKTSAARKKLKENNIPYISILTDPTTGGCAASFSMLGDLNIAEPGALIGFAGPRVIEQSIRQTLPEGFQRAEFLKEHGFIDRIVHRKHLKKELSFFLNILS